MAESTSLLSPWNVSEETQRESALTEYKKLDFNTRKFPKICTGQSTHESLAKNKVGNQNRSTLEIISNHCFLKKNLTFQKRKKKSQSSSPVSLSLLCLQHLPLRRCTPSGFIYFFRQYCPCRHAGFSLAADSGGSSLAECVGFPLPCLPLLRSTGSRA